MRNASEWVLKAFLSKLPPERKGALERFLPEKERLRLDELPNFAEGKAPEEITSSDMLNQVHWSWFIPTLRTYPEREQKLFLSALNPAGAQGLANELGLEDYAQEASPPAKGFFSQILLNSLVGPKEELLPIDYLPPSSLNRLLQLSKKELTQLIDQLALYDLAAEMRQIVETKTLKKIYSFLSEEERKTLKQIMAQQKEPFSLPRVGLDRWDGEEESLHLLLHRRGLARLATALSGQNPDLIWYICHQLDIGRGNALYKLCAKEPVPGFTEAVIRQIEELRT